MTGRRVTVKTVGAALGILACLAVGVGGGTLLARHLLARGWAPPRLSEIAAPPGARKSRPATDLPVGLSPVPPDEPRSATNPAAGGEAAGPGQIPWADPYPASAFTLVDHDAAPVSLRDFSGRVVLVNFIYTSCKTTCPLETQELRTLQKALGPRMGRDVVFLTVTIDPKRDTPEALKRYGEGHGADFRSWRFLTGSEAQIRAVLEAYRVPVRVETPPGAAPGHYELGHGNPIYLIDQWSRVRKRTAPTMLAQIGRPAIEQLVTEGARRAP